MPESVSTFHLYSQIILFLCFTFLITPLSLAQENSELNCIHILGDSVANGEVVTQVEGSGFPVIVTENFADILSKRLQDTGIEEVEVLDSSLPQSSLVPREGFIPYKTSPEYASALASDCEYFIIFPWLNDLPQYPSSLELATFHQEFDNLIQTMQYYNPDSKIIILSYYDVPMTELGYWVYGLAISPPVIQAANHEIQMLCHHYSLNGIDISCLNLNVVFSELDSYVLRQINRIDFYQANYYPLNNTHWQWFENFWRQQPNIPILCDAVHLNRSAKVYLANTITNHIFQLP